MKNISAGLVVALLLALVVGAGLIQAFANFTGGIELRRAAPALLQTSTMSVGAPTNPSNVNKTFDVPVDIADATNLGAYEFDLIWSNAGLLSVNSVTQGSFLGSTNRDVIELGPLTGTAGQMSVGAATCPVEDCQGAPDQPRIDTGATGGGTLATVKLDVPGSVPGGGGGYLDLTLSNAQITDVDANVQVLDTINMSIGVFPFQTSGGPAGRQNYYFIGMAVQMPQISDAKTLYNHVGPDMISVLKWNASLQAFIQWFAEDPDYNNFSIELGDGVLVRFNFTSSTNNVLIVGQETAFQYTSLQRGETKCLYNVILLPPSVTGVSTAADLAASVGGVVSVSRWVGSTQAFSQWFAEDPGYNNFNVEFGEPYLLCLDNPGLGPSWP